jgi:hypothetical protein
MRRISALIIGLDNIAIIIMWAWFGLRKAVVGSAEVRLITSLMQVINIQQRQIKEWIKH